MEEQLEATLEQYGSAQAWSGPCDSLVVTDQHGRIQRLNARASQMFGYESDELFGKSLAVLLPKLASDTPDKYLSCLVDQLRSLSDTGEPLQACCKDGSPVSVILSCLPIADRDVSLLVITFHDLQEWEQSNTSRAFLAAMVETSEDSIVGMDLEGTIVSWNAGAELLFGYQASEVLGKSITIVYPSDNSAAGHLARLAQIQHEERIERYTAQRLRKDGSQVAVSVIVSPVRDPDGHLIGMSAIHRDITKQIEAEEELQNAKRRAEKASQAKSEFLANMSHEIRTPMNAVLGMTELLLDTTLTEVQEDYARTIRRSGESLLTIINDILDFSKIEAGKLDIETTEFALESMVEGVAKLFTPRAAEKGVELNTCIDPSIPAMLLGDGQRIRQVLVNLTANAVRFTEKGTVSLRVLAEVHVAGPFLKFEVRDTGIGIAADVQKRIFSAFEQADGSTSRRYGGTGLGLSISRRLVEMMGGKIGVSSAPEQGSTFWFTIPLVKGSDSSVAESIDTKGFSTLRPLVVGGPANHRGTIQNQLAALNIPVKGSSDVRLLLVEDHEANRRLALHLLRKRGYHCDIASNGAEAVSKVAPGNYDLVLMDCQMPDMDGFQATIAIRALEGSWRHTPIIAMTANAMQGDRERCLASGMDDYIPKPLQTEEMYATIEEWLRHSPSGQSLGDQIDLKLVEELSDLIPDYLEGRHKDLTNISDALQRNDMDSVRRIGHGMKGSGAGYGFAGITDIGRALEEAAVEANRDSIQALHYALETYVDYFEHTPKVPSRGPRA